MKPPLRPSSPSLPVRRKKENDRFDLAEFRIIISIRSLFRIAVTEKHDSLCNLFCIPRICRVLVAQIAWIVAEFKNGILLWCGFKIIFTDKFGGSVDGFVHGSPALIIGIRCRTHTWVAVVCFYSIKVVNFDTLFNVFCNKFATASCV